MTGRSATPAATAAPRLRTLLVDDEPLARRALRQAMAAHGSLEVAGECGHGEEAVAAIRRLRPDLVLLDIQMPGMDGFDVLRALAPAELPWVVFVTAHDEHALRAFEARALDYLLKPFDQPRFDAAVERVVTLWRGRRAGEHGEGGERGEGGEPLAALSAAAPRLLDLLASLDPLAGRSDAASRAAGHLRRLSIRKSDHVVVLRTEDIDWLSADGNYVCIHAGGAAHLHRESLARLAAALDPARFLRIHRSVIVNLDRVREIHPLFAGDAQVVLADGTRLTLSRRYRDQARQALGLP